LIAPLARHTVALRKLSALREITGEEDDEVAQPAVKLRRAVWPN
jgi:hypothetical protein